MNMTRRIWNIPAIVAGCAFLLVMDGLMAHPDDPKVRDRQERVEGPGWRAAEHRPSERRNAVPEESEPMSGFGGEPGEGGPMFESLNVTLESWLTLSELGNASSGNDCWGYVSPSGREYALMGLSNGTAFVEITDPGDPNIVGIISGSVSLWRDIKVYSHYAYIVSEANGSGIQVVDMSQIDAGTVTLVNTVTGQGTDRTHNVAIDETSGFLYRCGGGNNGLRIYDLAANPVNPPYVGAWSTRYVHDAQIVTYESGPFAGRQIGYLCAGFNGGWVETGLTVLDLTDKNNIIEIGHYFYDDTAYSHQVWLSEDRKYAYLNDELDSDYGIPSRMHVFHVEDIENIEYRGWFTNGNPAVTHNIYIRGNLIFAANYRSGLRVFDRSGDPENPVEVAYFNTYPDDDEPSFNGLWSSYPFFPSGTVIGSDLNRGLFVWTLDLSIDGDINGDGVVDFADLLELLAAWGPCPAEPGNCPADLDGSGEVDFSDLLALLGFWGE